MANTTHSTRTVHDSMGELQVPIDALYGATTQRAIENFPISGLTMPSAFIQALGYIKAAAAQANLNLQLIDPKIANHIIKISKDVANNQYDAHFPIDIFQTGSGTSTNMNANEVIARLCEIKEDTQVHPNDHINMSQSSNDVIPTAIHVSIVLQTQLKLLPALKKLQASLNKRAIELKNITKTGRTHLMDAMPVTLGQELSGWANQIKLNIARCEAVLPRLHALAIGGTAVGTGINAHPDFSHQFVLALNQYTSQHFTRCENNFEALSTQDTTVEFSGQLKTLAVSLSKIANDLRWMNSGPLAGFGEIALPSLQPGSSIMPGKVNPVIPEAVAMVCAQVIGNDLTITMAGQSGNFQLNVMLPVIAYNILQSINLLSNACTVLAEKAIDGFTVQSDNIKNKLAKNPILITALNSTIGYELGAKIAKAAYQQQRPLIDVAKEMTSLSQAELERLLDPFLLTKGGIVK